MRSIIDIFHAAKKNKGEKNKNQKNRYTHLPLDVYKRQDYHRMLEVSNMIRKLNDEYKIIIIVSHDFEFLGRTCEKIFDMEGGSKERR